MGRTTDSQAAGDAGRLINTEHPLLVYVPVAPKMRRWPNLPVTSRPRTPEGLRSADVALLITDHSIVDHDLVLKNAPLIVDRRGIYRVRVRHVVRA